MKKSAFVLFYVLFSGFIINAFAQLETGENVAVTETESGKVRGYINNSIFTYKGIPYAEAARFESPQKPKPWTNVRSSMVYGAVAPLLEPTTTVTDEPEFVFNHSWGFTNENCMSINVWTPGLKDGKKRPVMFWIHGGGFTSGSSQELPSYDGEALAKKGDLVVVSINHRLNILGYLDLSAYGEKYKESANLSILDMKMALEWVKSNIANFGGDASNVTIFGQSGGGAKVNTLMAMPSAKGLFHKAINQSGSFRSALLDKNTTQALAAEVIKELGLSADKIDEIQKIPFPILSKAGAKAITTISNKLKAEGKPVGGFGLSWGPSVDGQVLPYQLLSNEAMELSKDIPLLIGTTKNEFTPFRGALPKNTSEAKAIEALKAMYADKTDAYVTALKKAYPNIQAAEYKDIDVSFRPGAVYQANLKSDVNKGAAVYMYLFDWQSPVMDGKYKAVHCMEIPFVFNNIARCAEMTGGKKDAVDLSLKMSQSWINFAKTGNPNHKGLVTWPAYNTTNTATMHFDINCEVKPQLDKDLFEVVK